MALQRYKQHAQVARLLEGGQLVRYGAKTIPVGGYWAMPRPYADGALLIGDSAGLFNSRRLKGVHLAIKSGMLAAETVYEALLLGPADGEGRGHELCAILASLVEFATDEVTGLNAPQAVELVGKVGRVGKAVCS